MSEAQAVFESGRRNDSEQKNHVREGQTRVNSMGIQFRIGDMWVDGWGKSLFETTVVHMGRVRTDLKTERELYEQTSCLPDAKQREDNTGSSESSGNSDETTVLDY